MLAMKVPSIGSAVTMLGVGVGPVLSPNRRSRGQSLEVPVDDTKTA